MEGANKIEVTIPSPGAQLEGCWDEPERASGAVVFCHAHPQQGGTMNAPLMHHVTRQLMNDHLAVLRFNFRGVGESTGEWDHGAAEVDDVAAAVATAQRKYPDSVYLAGWSFGGAMALLWQARSTSSIAFAGIAVPIETEHTPALPQPEELAHARRMFILGDRDQFIDIEAGRHYAGSVAARFEVLRGSDHFFYFREEKVGALISAFFDASG